MEMKLGVDIDDVIANFILTLALFHNETYGGNLSKNNFISYDFWKVWGGSKEDAVQKVDKMFTQQNYLKKILPIEQSFDSLKKLKESGIDLYAITGRRDNMAKQTTEWIKKHFPNIFLDIHFTNSYCLKGKSEKKSKICKKIGITTIIEDHLTHALDCAENDIQVLLYDNPWNKSLVKSKNIRRVFSWSEITEILQ